MIRQQWDDEHGLWRLQIRGGEPVTARFVVSSVGGYVNAKTTVDIEGVDDFTGTVLRPNAWDDSYDTKGKRIAVIGTGSSGVQITAAPVRGSRQSRCLPTHPAWVLPKSTSTSLRGCAD